MDKILVIGATGKIGKLLLSSLSALSYPVAAMVRDRRKYTFPDSIDVIEADLEGDMRFAFEGCKTVIFTAGSGTNTGLDKTFLVDLWGAKKAVDAAKESGVEHFIMVSSRGADHPDFGPAAIKPYLVAKHFSDEYLIRSGLTYTILRPGRLTDEAGSGLIKTLRPENSNEQVISREDTASVIKYCLIHPFVHGKIYELYAGQEKIPEAIAAASD